MTVRVVGVTMRVSKLVCAIGDGAYQARLMAVKGRQLTCLAIALLPHVIGPNARTHPLYLGI